MVYLKILVKLIAITILLYMGISIGMKGFNQLNSAAADLCFGFCVMAFMGVLVVMNI
jgi:hypothetical protein